MASWSIVESELIEWLKHYGGPRYHAVLSDPPYALISITKRFGKAGSAPAQEGSDGRYSRLSGGFMGQKWDGFKSLEHYQKWVSEWSKLMIERLLYPGAVCLFFGGTRTFHHLGVGLENGGFEIVDSILIPWLHGQGFPKGHRQVTKLWDNILSCQLKESAPLVVQTSKPMRLKSNSDTELTALALARILPEGDPALIMETGRAEDSREVTVMSLSSLKGLELTDLNMTSLWKKQSGVRYDKVSTFITQTKINLTTASKIWSFYQSASTQKNTRKAAILANGQQWYACNVVTNSSEESTKPNVTPILTVLGSVTENPIRSWSGHNVALKPSWEPVFVCRSPRRGWSFAELAIEFGTGALAIDKSRINQASPDRAYASGMLDASSDIQTFVDNVPVSLESCLDSLRSVLSALGSDSTSDKDPSHDISDQDDSPPFDHPNDRTTLSRLYPNDIWCGLSLSIASDSLDDCPACRSFYDGLLRPVQEAAPKDAPSLIGALEHIYQVLLEPSHNPCSNSDHRPIEKAPALVFSLCKLLIDYSSQLYTKRRNKQAGRWPANLVLTHHEACVKVGEYETKGRVINRWKDGMIPFGGGAGQEYETIDPTREGEASADRTYEDEGGTDFAMKPGARRGMETVDLYACVPGCPVRALDDQVGELKTGDIKPHRNKGSWKQSSENITGSHVGDTGGPSRFFYTAKASRSEKDKGLEKFYWERTDDGFERISLEEYEKLDKQSRAVGCIHPTVKPTELLRYLSTLILPPKEEGRIRRILIPFSGIGSEMIGAAQAGWDEVLGIEMEPNYTMMAEAHIRATIGMF